MVAAKKKSLTIDAQLREFEQRLRRQLLKERLAEFQLVDEHPEGVLPQIHVSVAALAASRPRPVQHASGD